ncbi:MAG: saccharopine dehydrogenase NADP-binding domain-containing protein [Giesbergeria sp.]
MKVLVLGGYGNFGARICRALAQDGGIELVVAGRDLARAQTFASALGGSAQGIALDVQAPGLAEMLRSLGVALVIHTAGPFQQQSYGVAHAAAAASVHYIDLADGRRFVCDFPAALHGAFVAAGCFGVSGASTVPALSSAVVEHLRSLEPPLADISTIDTCIAPAQTAPRGEATLAGVLSYCGEPIRVWNEGSWQERRGWADMTPVRFARLRQRWGALCDIPDLEIFPKRYQVRQRVYFLAALEVRWAQRIFAALAALRAKRLVGPLARWAGWMNRCGGIFDRFGTALGGMVVRVAGRDAAGQEHQRAWHIAADNDDGPEIPCMAAIVLARRLAAGAALPAGAYTSAGVLSLADFEPEFARWGMVTDVEISPPAKR